VYFFARYLGLGEIFEAKYPKKVRKIKEKLSYRWFLVLPYGALCHLCLRI
jgi:hypothetical protein